MSTSKVSQTFAKNTFGKLDEQFVQAFAAGVLETIKTLCKTDARWVVENAVNSTVRSRDVMASIPLVSSSLNGRVVLSMEQSTFLSLMGRMRGKSYSHLENEISDGVAEFLNILFGVAKRSLNTKGYDIEIALPEMSPPNRDNEDARSSQHVVMIFTTDYGSVYLNLVIQ